MVLALCSSRWKCWVSSPVASCSWLWAALAHVAFHDWPVTQQGVLPRCERCRVLFCDWCVGNFETAQRRGASGMARLHASKPSSVRKCCSSCWPLIPPCADSQAGRKFCSCCGERPRRSWSPWNDNGWRKWPCGRTQCEWDAWRTRGFLRTDCMESTWSMTRRLQSVSRGCPHPKQAGCVSYACRSEFFWFRKVFWGAAPAFHIPPCQCLKVYLCGIRLQRRRGEEEFFSGAEKFFWI